MTRHRLTMYATVLCIGYATGKMIAPAWGLDTALAMGLAIGLPVVTIWLGLARYDE